MRSSRLFLTTILLAAFAACSLIYTSCKNKCGSTTCQNGGTCESNVCVCPVGYSGNACQTGWADAAVGTYTCQRSNCNPAVAGVSYWQSSVTKDANNGGYTIDISNFNNSNTSVVATVDSSVNGVGLVKIGSSNGTGTDATGHLVVANGITTITLEFQTYTGGVGGSQCTMTMRKE